MKQNSAAERFKKVEESKRREVANSHKSQVQGSSVKPKFEGMVPECQATFDFKPNGVDITEKSHFTIILKKCLESRHL
jgi:hypothetical protein